MAEEFRPKIFSFCCKRSAPKQVQDSSAFQQDADVNITLLDCSGKLELINLVEPFLKGADGIFTSGCFLGECHFKNGNLQAESKVVLGKKILDHSSLNTERLAFYNIPPGDDEQFNQTMKGFINNLKSVGPIGTIEKLSQKLLQLKLQAAFQAVQGKKLNWVISRRYQFMEKGNRYGEIFTNHEMERMLDDIAMDECRLQQIHLLLKQESLSVIDIAQRLNMPSPQALLHLSDLKRMGMADIGEVKDNTPLWQATAL